MEKKLPERYFYPAVFTFEEGQEIAVVFPDLECATSGTDEGDALLSARECLGSRLALLEEFEEEIAEPSKLENIKADNNEKVMLIDVYMPSYRMAGVSKSVNRTVTLPAWMNAKAMEYKINFSQALQDTLREKYHIVQ